MAPPFLALLFFHFCTWLGTPTRAQSVPSAVCFIGTNRFGSVVNPFADNELRTLMGTFAQIASPTFNQHISPLSVDYTSPIYRHSNYGEADANFLFRIADLGYVLSKTAPPDTA